MAGVHRLESFPAFVVCAQEPSSTGEVWLYLDNGTRGPPTSEKGENGDFAEKASGVILWPLFTARLGDRLLMFAIISASLLDLYRGIPGATGLLMAGGPY